MNLENRVLNSIFGGISLDDSLISNIFINSFMNQGTYLMKCTNSILKKHKIDYIRIFTKERFILNDELLAENWKINIIKELLYCRDFELFNLLNKQEIELMLNQICTN